MIHNERNKTDISLMVCSVLYLIMPFFMAYINKFMGGDVFPIFVMILSFIVGIFCLYVVFLLKKNLKDATALEKSITLKIKNEGREIYWGQVSHFGVFYFTSLGIEFYYTKSKFVGWYYKKKDNYRDGFIPLKNIVDVTLNKKMRFIKFNLIDDQRREIYYIDIKVANELIDIFNEKKKGIEINNL